MTGPGLQHTECLERTTGTRAWTRSTAFTFHNASHLLLNGLLTGGQLICERLTLRLRGSAGISVVLWLELRLPWRTLTSIRIM